MTHASASSEAPSICLVRLSALGDVVLVLPMIRTLQARWPGLRLTWVIGKGALPIVAGLESEGVEFIPIDKPRSVGDYLALRRRLADRHFDYLFCLQASWRANWLYPCISATRKIGYGADRAKDLHRFFIREALPPAKAHLAEGFLQFAEQLGVPAPARADWRLPLDPEALAWSRRELPNTPFLALSACASKPERDWPVERYAAVLRQVKDRHALPIVLLGGRTPREIEMAQRILSVSGVPALNLVGRTTIPQLSAALSACRLLIAPDTGAVHIANAHGRPVVGLYGVAPASRTGPYGHLDTCVDVFAEAVRTLQGRDPATVTWAHRVHDPKAMELISVENVIGRVESILGQT
jgi:heptosyltransferase I